MINQVYDSLLNCIENNSYDNLKMLVKEDVKFNFSATGEGKGVNELIKALKLDGLDICKVKVFNNVIRKENGNCKQSCYNVFTLGKTVNDFMHLFQCGFLVAVEYEGDLIKIIKARMSFEWGNSLIVGDKWKLIDYSLPNGNENKIICDQNDSPWLVSDTDFSDEEMIKQCFYHYNWLIDVEEFDQLGICYKDPYLMKVNKKIAGKDGDCISVKQSSEIFKNTRYRKVNCGEITIPREACWNHIAHFDKLEIFDDYALADIYRYEPNRIGTRFLNKYTFNKVYYSGEWKIKFEKENGIWKISEFSFENKIIEDDNNCDKRYF